MGEDHVVDDRINEARMSIAAPGRSAILCY